MSDEAAPVEAPAAPAAEAPAPAPEQTESPLKKESFREAFERHQAKIEAQQTEKPAEPSAPAPKPGKKVVQGEDTELEQLKALAAKRGYVIEDGKVMPSERAKFREYQRQRDGKLTQTEQERLSAIEKREKEVADNIKQAQSILKAKADGDYQGLAKELGFESWDKLQEDVIARISDPNYKRLRELEEKDRAREEEAAKTKAETERQQQQKQAAENRQRVYDRFAAEMPQSKDPLVAAMGDHPLFVNAILAVQQENWTGPNSALPYERIAGMARKGAPRTIREECKDLYDRLHKAFGGQQQAAPPKAKPMPGKSAPVAPSRGTEASPARSMTREERNAYERRVLADAIAKDRAAGL